VEAEVTEFLGRARYQRAANTQDARPGARNGYCPTTIKTTAGPVTIDRPKLRGTTERFASRLFGAGVTKTNALASLVIAGLCAACRCATWRPPSPTPSARKLR
jgi:transposase-like protein